MKKHSDALLDITAIVLANLCVAYIMTSQNELAEELMRQVEREEERAQMQVGGQAGQGLLGCKGCCVRGPGGL